MYLENFESIDNSLYNLFHKPLVVLQLQYENHQIQLISVLLQLQVSIFHKHFVDLKVYLYV